MAGLKHMLSRREHTCHAARQDGCPAAAAQQRGGRAGLSGGSTHPTPRSLALSPPARASGVSEAPHASGCEQSVQLRFNRRIRCMHTTIPFSTHTAHDRGQQLEPRRLILPGRPFSPFQLRPSHAMPPVAVLACLACQAGPMPAPPSGLLQAMLLRRDLGTGGPPTPPHPRPA